MHAVQWVSCQHKALLVAGQGKKKYWVLEIDTFLVSTMDKVTQVFILNDEMKWVEATAPE